MNYILNSYKYFYKNCLNYSGIAGRKEYWTMGLILSVTNLSFLLLAYFLLFLIFPLGILCLIVYMIFGCVNSFAAISLLVRRFRDVGISPWWIIPAAIPYAIPVIVIACLPSKSTGEKEVIQITKDVEKSSSQTKLLNVEVREISDTNTINYTEIASKDKEKLCQEFKIKKAKLAQALAMDIISIKEYEEQITSYKKLIEYFDEIRKIEIQHELEIITEEEKDMKINQLLDI